MTVDGATETPRILGSLRSADGAGVVRIEDRLEADASAVWDALTDPERLAAWYGEVEGDFRPGGALRIFIESDGWRGTGRVETCEPGRRLVVTSRESDESWQEGAGAEPFDETIEVVLSGHGDETEVVIEVAGLPLDKVAFYGAGWQIHAESLGRHLAGGSRGDVEARWDELVPPYLALAAALGR